MAMKTASPWWFSAMFVAGLVLIFLGERPFDHISEARMVFTGLGALLVLGTSLLRLWTFAGSTGDRRAVERAMLMCHVGVLVGLVVYLLSTSVGTGLFGIDTEDAKALSRFEVPMTVVWGILIMISVIPLLMVEFSLGTARREKFVPSELKSADADQEAVESFRVREIASSGLTIALALAFLMVTCNVAKQRNTRIDVSYFKTSSPGTATQQIVKSGSEPVKALLFFPKVSEVKTEVLGYFETLEDETGNVEVEEHDRFISASLAKKYQVNTDGTLVLAYGDKHERIKLTVDPKRLRTRAARTELRELDGKVNASLMKLIRERRTAYFTVGHGELNDPGSFWVKARNMKTNQLKKQLRDQNYQVKDLGLAQGLSNAVPDDADLVIILGPTETFLDEELGAIDRYLAQGGSLLIALDPLANASLGSLEGRLGVTFNRTPVTDDKQHMTQTRTITDRRLVITNRFSSHASITTLSRAAARYGIVMINAGSLDNVDFAAGNNKAKRTFVIRSMATAFGDVNNNFKFDAGGEKRGQLNLVAAIEDPNAKPPAKPDDAGEDKKKKAKSEGMRVMVFGDAEIFTDLIQVQVEGARAMFGDAVKWLGGEEHIAGEIVSEKDVIIEHTRNEDVLLFYSTIVGAPLLVLGFGLWFGWWRRNRKRRAS